MEAKGKWLVDSLLGQKGGEGSGNFGHAGDPPNVGGSAPGDAGDSGTERIDPHYEFGNPRLGVSSRADYERVCKEQGIEARDDMSIKKEAYRLKYAEFGETWNKMTREQRVRHLVEGEYLPVIEAQAKIEREQRRALRPPSQEPRYYEPPPDYPGETYGRD